MYDYGKGVPENDVEAVKWYRKAAEQGHKVAQHDLGYMYYKGEGVPQNYAKALTWVSLAKALGYVNAEVGLDMIKEQMTPAQIVKAQALATEWWEKHNN